jgi:hypothetical protein
MNKKLLAILAGVLLIGGALAVSVPYIVSYFSLKVDVNEPLSVQYAIIGDASNWDGQTGCDAEGLTWSTYTNGFLLDVQGLYAGEGRNVCFKITNLAEANIDYTITSKIVNLQDEDQSWTTYTKCLNAFGEHTLTGTANQLTDTLDGAGIVVAQNAEPVSDCLVEIKVGRG